MPGRNGMMAHAPQAGLQKVNMLSETAEFVIQGITMEGDIFQPPGWAERLCAAMPSDGGGVGEHHASYLRAEKIAGVQCVVVRASLQKDDSATFDKIRQFVAVNRLKVRAGRGSRDAEATGPHPVFKERRNPERNNW